jgi:hypothetical protein
LPLADAVALGLLARDADPEPFVDRVASGADRVEDVLDESATQWMVAHLDAVVARLAAGEPLAYVLGTLGENHRTHRSAVSDATRRCPKIAGITRAVASPTAGSMLFAARTTISSPANRRQCAITGAVRPSSARLWRA